VYPAARYKLDRRMVKGKPCLFHVLSIDLTLPGTQFVVSPPKYIGYKTREFAQEMEAQAAVNGGFWKLVTHDPLGLVVSAGRRWPDAADDDKHGFLAFTKDGEAWISPPEERKHPSSEEAYMAISGFPMIVRDGEIGRTRGCGYICMVGPRTAVGLDETGETITFVVVDGRQKKSGGTDLTNLAQYMIDQGIHEALNLDGGGSSTLYLANRGGVVNTPSEGRERAVLNNIAIFLAETLPEPEPEPEPDAATDAAQPADAGAAPAAAPPGKTVTFAEEDFEPTGSPDPPLLLKKLLVVGGAGGVVVLIAAGVVMLIRRRRERR
jgi:hypothetical protein